MKKLLIPVLLASLLTACGTTPSSDDQAGGAPVETIGRDQIVPVQPGQIDASGLPSQLTDPKSILARRSVYFDYDKYDVRESDRDLIAAHAKFLNANRQFKMLIQGNTDERGSREYNLSLGQKRSDAVKQSLMLLGAREEQIESVSLGKEKPTCAESTEDCWSKNRRADVLYRAPSGKGEF